MRPQLRVLRLRGGASAGRVVEYRAAARLQEALRALRRADAVEDCLILLEHSPVYTLGRRTAAEVRRRQASAGKAADTSLPRQHEHLLFDDSSLGSTADVVATKRGGQVTYHGPGQLVGYPVLHLRHLARRDRTLSPRGYLPAVEEVLQQTLARFGVRSTGRSDQGAAYGT